MMLPLSDQELDETKLDWPTRERVVSTKPFLTKAQMSAFYENNLPDEERIAIERMIKEYSQVRTQYQKYVVEREEFTDQIVTTTLSEEERLKIMTEIREMNRDIFRDKSGFWSLAKKFFK